MSDVNRPHHSNGVCLSCGGLVDDAGMAMGGEVDDADDVEHEATDMSGGPAGDEAEDLAAKNARDFARAVNGGR